MMEPTDLVKRLAATPFKGDLRALDWAESSFRSAMNVYQGYLALSTAFMRFFLETMDALDEKIPRTAPTYHRILVERLVHGFQTLRAAQLTAHNGYPMQGFTLLRNVHDDCVLTSAAMQGLTDFEELAGGKPEGASDPNVARKNRINAERKVRSRMDGPTSGLSAEILKWLRVLDDMYDQETHGARLSQSQNFGWLKGEASLPVVPTFTESKAALFMNRFCEVAWIVHRLLPLTQLPGLLFTQDWGGRWRIVDGSFHYLTMSLAKDLGKPVFAAVCDFVAMKFPFDEKSQFPC